MSTPTNTSIPTFDELYEALRACRLALLDQCDRGEPDEDYWNEGGEGYELVERIADLMKRYDNNEFIAFSEVDDAAVGLPPAEWSGSPDPDDPDNYWIDDVTGERVNAHTGERTRK